MSHDDEVNLVSIPFFTASLRSLEEQHGPKYYDRDLSITNQLTHHLAEAESLYRSLPDVVATDSCPECGGALWSPEPDPGWRRCRVCNRLWSPDGEPWTPGVEG